MVVIWWYCVLKRISQTRLRGYVTDGFRRALEWHSRGQRFDPAYLHQAKSLETQQFRGFFAFVYD